MEGILIGIDRFVRLCGKRSTDGGGGCDTFKGSSEYVVLEDVVWVVVIISMSFESGSTFGTTEVSVVVSQLRQSNIFCS